MKTDVIIQARLRSTRLPNKVLMELGDTTLLGQVIRRAKAIPGIDTVCIAMPDLPGHEKLEEEALKHGAHVTKGSESDVMGRYYKAACELGSEVIVRVTSDCPFIYPELTGAMIKLREHSNADYVCINMPLTWPHGTETEVFTFDILEKGHKSIDDPFQREHVSPFMRLGEGVKRANLVSRRNGLLNHRWTIDHPEDMKFARTVMAALGADSQFSYSDMLEYLAAHPEVTKINQQHERYTAQEPWVQSYYAADLARPVFEEVE